MDAIELLEQQHRETETLFDRFEAAGSDEQKAEIATEVIADLRVHTTIEEEIFYPALREADEDLEDDVLEGYEEHHAVELLMDELDGMSPDDERFEAKFTVVKEFVLHHVEEEENDMFPQAREALGEDRLRELGEQMQARADELRAGSEDATKEELYERAKELDIEGRSQMSKRELARALQQAS